MKLLLILTLLAASSLAQAKTVWSDFSVTLLKGDDYEVGDNDRTVMTLEYASGTTWGDVFLFVDRLESSNDDNETYGEFSPRIKLSDIDAGFIKNIYLSGTLEMGAFSGADGFTNSFTNYLVGVGTDLNLPHFNFAKLSVYHRNNDQGDNGYQTTLSWGVPVGPLYYDGFIDWASSTDNSATTMNFTSQLKYDVGPHFNLDTKLYFGIEYAHWLNKFGIDGVDEKNVNLLVKYHF